MNKYQTQKTNIVAKYLCKSEKEIEYNEDGPSLKRISS